MLLNHRSPSGLVGFNNDVWVQGATCADEGATCAEDFGGGLRSADGSGGNSFRFALPHQP